MAKKLQDMSSSSEKEKMASERIYISKPGEYYYDQLTIEAWLKGNTVAGEAKSLLCARLMQRKEYREEMIDWLARKRGVSRQELIDAILSGTADELNPNEYQEVKQRSKEEEDE